MKKKGFTLIELLAVIVILSIVAIITVVVIGNVIEEAKIKKYYSEEKAMEHAAELYLVKNQNSLENVVSTQEISLQQLITAKNMKPVHDTGNGGLCDGKVLVTVDDNNKKNIKFKGCLECSNYQTEDQECGFESKEEKEEIVEDKKAYCLESETKDNITYYYIDSVEDLYAFSDSVNSGTSYYSRVVMLRNNLDMSKSISSTQETCDGKKVTVNTFKPIGTSSSKFSGTFEGNGKTISNLKINEPSMDNVGLFGYSDGKLKGITLKNANITGNNNVGGLLGHDEGSIYAAIVTGNVNGNDYVGGAVGVENGRYDPGISGRFTYAMSILSNTNVTSTNNAGGLFGYLSGKYTHISGIVNGGTIKGNNAVKVAIDGSNSNLESVVLVSNDVVLDATSTNGISGASFDSKYKNRLNGYDGYLDTYINGDNDSSGYYFDYDKKKNIVIKSKTNNPIPNANTLKGSGTLEDPYQIGSVEDYKVAVANVNYYYKLTSDIDFKNEEIYMLGSNSNIFSRGLNGNGHTIKNAKILGIEYSGLFGNSSGTIEYLNISNLTLDGRNRVGTIGYNSGVVRGINVISTNITGNNDVGGLIGYNEGLIDEVSISGNVTGNENVGGAIGTEIGRYDPGLFYGRSAYDNSILSNVNVTSLNRAGGLIGCLSSYYVYVSGIVEGGTLKGKNVSKGAIVSYARDVTFNVYVSDGVTIESDSLEGYNGTRFNSDNANNLYHYGNTLGLDTSYTGDKGNNGYYFDYTSDNTDILVTKVGSSTPASDNDIVEDEETGVKPTPGVVSKSHTSTTCENDKVAPTCTLNSFSARSSKDGMTASFTCTDNVGVTSISSLFDSTRSYKARNFDDIGTIKPGIATDNNGMYWFSTWTAYTDPAHPPQSGICYFFHYGAIDNCGNYSTYKTNYCLGY